MNIGLVAVDRPCALSARPNLLSSVFLAKRFLHAGGRPSVRPSVNRGSRIVDRGSWIACFAYITRISPRESWGMREDQSRLPKTPVPANFADSTPLDRLHGADPEPEPGTDGRTDELTFKS